MDDPEDPGPAPPASGASRLLEGTHYFVVIGAATALALSLAAYGWSVAKAVSFVDSLLGGSAQDDVALVKLFAAVDVILIGTVMLIIGLGLWELFVHDLDLPPALTTTSFDDLKAKIASTLVLVLVVQFLENLVEQPSGDELMKRAIAVTLVGLLLVVFARWRPTTRSD